VNVLTWVRSRRWTGVLLPDATLCALKTPDDAPASGGVTTRGRDGGDELSDP
jgi:hypothetical protein